MRLAEITVGQELMYGTRTQLAAGDGAKKAIVAGIGPYTEVTEVGCPGKKAHLLTEEEIKQYRWGKPATKVFIRTTMRHYNNKKQEHEEIECDAVVTQASLMPVPEYKAKATAREAVLAAGKAHDQIERDILKQIEALVQPHMLKLGLTAWARPHSTRTLTGGGKTRRITVSNAIRIDAHETPNIRDPELLAKLPKATQAKLVKLFDEYDAWCETPHPATC